ncbi:hypothetical protein [Marinimicrobium agarilyticum]|uniref:hypothetical protein n=1 Tax=Marinimicrobium agarilyticum TaxID=306546 RepID=UPI000483DEE4|nr:hypothetical protein [Marinimicrobium agarilyticum]
MDIEGSVGVGGSNNSVDIKLVQAALNLINACRLSSAPELAVDGMIGESTNTAIQRFQKEVVRMGSPDSRVDPGGATIRHIRTSVPKGFNLNVLRAIMALSATRTVDPYYPLFSSLMGQYSINTPLRIAHFLAQVGHESLSLTYTEEIASGQAYEGRTDLGNTEKGDGVRFKGRGLIQLTGRSNYAEYGQHSCLNLMKKGNETMISRFPKYAVDVSLWFWNSRNLNRYADNDDLRAVTRRVNGGYNGLDDRRKYLNRAKFFLL